MNYTITLNEYEYQLMQLLAEHFGRSPSEFVNEAFFDGMVDFIGEFEQINGVSVHKVLKDALNG